MEEVRAMVSNRLCGFSRSPRNTHTHQENPRFSFHAISCFSRFWHFFQVRQTKFEKVRIALEKPSPILFASLFLLFFSTSLIGSAFLHEYACQSDVLSLHVGRRQWGPAAAAGPPLLLPVPALLLPTPAPRRCYCCRHSWSPL